ncbi:MAG: alpha/beta hydrolase, partial [bacterium]|nr:alpha/beta hydrolase [bacterium]
MPSMNTERFSISFENESFEVVANVRQAGDEMLLLVHGLGGSKEAYYHVWDRSDFAEYSIVAIDLVGFGDSDKPSGFPYTMAAQARVVADVLARFADKKIHMIVHSMGCAIGLLLGDEILGSLETFVNIEGNLIGVDCEFGSRGMVSVTRDVFAAEMWPKLQAKYADLPRG